MKRKFFCSLLAAVAIFAVCASTAFAEAQLHYVTDDAGILTESEDLQLESMAKSVSKRYGVGVFLDNFSEDDWYGGLEDYIEECSFYLQKATEGKPVRESPVFYIIIMAGMSLFLAFLVVGFMWVRMKSVAKERTAAAYVAGDLNLTGQSDVFTYRTETRQKIESSSSGGSRSHSGGGGSGRSGKF